MPSTFGPRGSNLSNPASFLRPAHPMALTIDDNAKDKQSVLHPSPATFLRDFMLYITTNDNILWKIWLNYTACLTLSLPAYHCRQWKSWRKYASPVAKGLTHLCITSHLWTLDFSWNYKKACRSGFKHLLIHHQLNKWIFITHGYFCLYTSRLSRWARYSPILSSLSGLFMAKKVSLSILLLTKPS